VQKEFTFEKKIRWLDIKVNNFSTRNVKFEQMEPATPVTADGHAWYFYLIILWLSFGSVTTVIALVFLAVFFYLYRARNPKLMSLLGSLTEWIDDKKRQFQSEGISSSQDYTDDAFSSSEPAQFVLEEDEEEEI
jgi:hypothetical protein